MWRYVVFILLIGYLAFGRSFAYLGLPQANLFISEIVLASFLLLVPRSSFGTIIAALATRRLLTGYAIALASVLFLGIWQLVRGIMIGNSPMAALQNLVFNVYPLYFLVGIYVGRMQPDASAAVIRYGAWVVGIYGVAYLLYLRGLELTAFYADVEAFGQPIGASVALLGLLCYQRKLWPVAIPVMLNVVLLLGLQVRAEWLGFAAAIGLWSVLTGRVHKAVGIAIAGILILALIEVSGLQITGRSAQLTLSDTVGRLIAPVMPDVAAELTTRARSAAGTFEWRTKWWGAIWDSVWQDWYHLLLGNGYGFRLQSLVSYLRDFQEDIRTPHNFMFYALGYGGITMAIAYLGLLASLAHLGFKYFLKEKQAFPLCLVVMTSVNALASNLFETPFGAVPFFLLTGLALGPMFRQEQTQLARQRFAAHQQFSHGAAG